MRTYSGREVLGALRRAGFEQESQRGRNVKVRNAAGRTVIVPHHREIMHGTMRSILRQADLTAGEFEKYV